MYLLFCSCHLVNKEHAVTARTRLGGESLLSVFTDSMLYLEPYAKQVQIQQMIWHVPQTIGSQ